MSGWFSLSVDVALKSSALLGCAWCVSLAMRRCSAASRHLLWTGAAIAALALPVLAVMLPALRVPLPESTGVVFSAVGSTPATANAALSSDARGGRGNAVPPGGRFDWRSAVLMVWGLGTALTLVRMLLGFLKLRQRGRAAARFADGEVCGPVEVLASEPGSMPVTFGVFRPVIFMPSDAVQWTPERRRMVLLHELAHVRRGDAATHLLARAAWALHWWNPLAWKAWREFLKESECAADDLVLDSGARATEYATHLLEVARSMQSAPVMGLAMARRSQLEGRLRAILDARVNRKAPGRAWVAASALLAVGLVAPLAAVRAQESAAIPTDLDRAIRSAQSQRNAAVLEDIARVAEQQRKLDVARRLVEAAADIHRTVSGDQSKEYGVALIKLGELESRQNDPAAEAAFSQAAQVLGDRPEAAPALTHFGITALGKKDYAAAFEDFQRAQAVEPGSGAMWMAVTRAREGRTQEADALFQSALSQKPDSAITASLYAEFLRNHDRKDDAVAMDARALSMRNASAKPRTAPSANVYRIGGGVKPPSVLEKVEPQYSLEARAAALDGTLVLNVEIGTDGLAHNPQVVRSLGLGLDEQGIDAISQWRFRPGTKDGQAVAVLATIEINFRLL